MAKRKRREVNIALIGQGFMGRAHSNGWSQVGRFFDVPLRPVLHTVCGLDERRLRKFARNWGWKNFTTDWERLVKSDDIDLVDIGTPNFTHAPMAAAALAAGKHVACEKPLARTLKEARAMARAAKSARAKTFVWFNYRRCPAVALAHKLVNKGLIGKIRHVRAVYLQDWADETVPLTWRFDRRLAGSGAHGDLNAHIVDMARFVTGLEFVEICGAIAETFVKRRKLVNAGAAKRSRSGKWGRVTVDDTVLFLARLRGGAVASFEAARQATGCQNRNRLEIHGTKGALRFDFSRMNELDYYDAGADRAVQGWTTIMCTRAGDHPYADAWWPDAHLIGYEHGFTNMACDILRVLAGRKPIVPLPDFEDASRTQRVLEAALIAAGEKRFVKVSSVR